MARSIQNGSDFAGIRRRREFMSQRVILSTFLALGPWIGGCVPPSSSAVKAKAKPAPAAKVEKLPGEGDLTTVHLTEAAEASLRVATAKVERKAVPRSRTYGGEVVIPAGGSITVSAPLSGIVLAPLNGPILAAGAEVKRGREVFRLQPLLSPESRATMANSLVDAQGQVDQADKAMAQAKVLMERAERLRRDQLGSSGALIDAQSAADIATSAWKAATARRDALDRTIRGLEGGSLDALPILAEADGSIKGVHVLPGQAVAAGAILFDMESLGRVWVRVPVYVGDRRTLDLAAEAHVGDLAGGPNQASKLAKPVAAPPSGDPLATTVHLFYEVDNADHAIWPGQRVGVTIPMVGEAEALVVPWSAVLFDYQGGTWVYVKLADRVYSRRRVRLERQSGGEAILRDGPKPGTEVVTDGVAELFGSEFGGAK